MVRRIYNEPPVLSAGPPGFQMLRSFVLSGRWWETGGPDEEAGYRRRYSLHRTRSGSVAWVYCDLSTGAYRLQGLVD